LLDIAHGFSERLRIARAKDNLRPVASQLNGDGTPYPSTGAGHDRGPRFH
jgi:hypothetical protein